MDYILSYKGKKLGQPMDRDKAEAVLKQMSLCFNDLQLVPFVRQQPTYTYTSFLENKIV